MAEYNIKIPETLIQEINPEELIDLLLDLYHEIITTDLDELEEKNCSKEALKRYMDEFFQLSQEYGKLRQEYGIHYFHANELYNRNTLTGIKLGSLKQKLYSVKKIWGDNISLDYLDALKLIDHFSQVYLFKKEEEKKSKNV